MEAVGGLIAAEAVSTVFEAGAVYGGYAIAKSTLPLKGSFSRIGTFPSNDSPDSLARSSHTLNAIDDDLYIFGGQVSETTLAGNEVHILKLSNAGGLGPQYQAVPAVCRDGDDVPRARAGHASVVIDNKLVVFGGHDNATSPQPISEGGRVWLFDPQTSSWSHLDAASESYPERHSHAAVAFGNKLIIHGGICATSSEPLSDTWSFDLGTRIWIELAALEKADPTIAPPNFAISNNILFLVTGSDDLSSNIHTLDLSAEAGSNPIWNTLSFPSNPLTPGPRPRKGAGLVPVSTGMGRHYLLFVFGAKDKADSSASAEHSTDSDGAAQDFWSGVWALQVPAPQWSGAQIKDAAREKVPGLRSNEAEWAEVEIVLSENPEEMQGGKSHPGPRGYFASAAASETRVVLWGGINAKGEREGDGWAIDIEK